MVVNVYYVNNYYVKNYIKNITNLQNEITKTIFSYTIK